MTAKNKAPLPISGGDPEVLRRCALHEVAQAAEIMKRALPLLRSARSAVPVEDGDLPIAEALDYLSSAITSAGSVASDLFDALESQTAGDMRAANKAVDADRCNASREKTLKTPNLFGWDQESKSFNRTS